MADTTTARGYKLPHPDNIAREDAQRIREAIEQISADVDTLEGDGGIVATEVAVGKVRLATAVEAAAGTATNAVPVVKRVQDMINGLAVVVAAQVAAKATPADITAAITALKGGVGPAYDTLVEIADKLGSDDTAIAGILTALGSRLRFDAAQTLSSGEKTQAQSNLGLLAAALKAIATVSNIKSNTNTDVITTDAAWDAGKWQPLGNVTGAITIDASLGCRFYGTMTGNVTVDVTGLKDGQPLEIIFLQDATGGRTVGWATKFYWPGGNVPGVTTTATAVALVASCEGTWTTSLVIGTAWKIA